MATTAEERAARSEDAQRPSRKGSCIASQDAMPTGDHPSFPARKRIRRASSELACECTKVDCERLVKVPLYVYRRMLESDQYLLQAGHHAFPQYRTIISVGLMRIEERI